MKSGLQGGIIGTLPKEELKDFHPNQSIKQKKNQENFLEYAKQRELLANLDKKLDYHNLQKDRHPYINELRSYMEEKRRTTKNQSGSQ